ncbi:MAG: class I SAM-dependent methyltransferase [Propionibacteriaceae bacterium]|nr:class I SAM-dependent methyltransferase [Propionibacteriaceae bacterium]
MSSYADHSPHDRDNEANSTARSDAVAAAVIAALPDMSELTVLDYGCGAKGSVGLRLADRVHQVVLADADPEAVSAVEVVAKGRANVVVRLLDLTEDVPSDLAADVVVSTLSWHHIADLGPLLEALPSVAGGGRLFVADMDDDGGAYHADDPRFTWIHGFDRDELAGLVGEHGYADVQVADLWRGSKWVAGQLVEMSVFCLTARIPTLEGAR